MPFTGIRTLNDRLLIVLCAVMLGIIATAFYAHHMVKESAEQSLRYIEANRDLSVAISEYKNTLQRTESMMHQYSTFLSREQYDFLLIYLDDLNRQASAFIDLPSIQTNSSLLQQSQQLAIKTEKLTELIREYMTIMENVESRYPGMPILLTHLEPMNRKFSESVELALQEGELTGNHPRVIERDLYRIMQLFQEARYAWSMQISWLRVFVANRMGAFGDPETAMQNNLKNRALFASTVYETLNRLDQFNKQGMLGLQQEESLSQMREALNYYNNYVEKAVEMYSSKNWRADVALLRDTLQPVLDANWKTVYSLEQAITETNNQSITQSQNTANALSIFIWAFTTVVLLMLIASYWVFQRKIRHPILQLANTMQSNNTNNALISHPHKNIDEINRLVNAYNDMHHQVSNRQRRLESILDNAAEGIITIDEHGLIESFNIAAQTLFGYQPSNILGKRFDMLFDAERLENMEQSMIRKIIMGQASPDGSGYEIHGRRSDGSEFFMSIKFSEMQIAARRYITAIVDDISERRAVMDHLRHLAEHDSLTGLYNRQYFNDQLERFFAHAQRDKERLFACLYIDLDNFKYINDTLGHLEGDRLLIGIASTLQTRTRKSDILARLGGDEFALLLINVTREQVKQVADVYRSAIANFSFIAQGKHIDTGCSIGVAMYEPDIENKEILLARADIACHMAKRAGRNRVHLFEHEDKGRIDTFYEEMGWTRRIRNALENKGFVFSCQPILRVADESIFSHELLLRMVDDETGEYIMPSGFLDSAERFGLMPEIDRWVVEHAFQWLNNRPEYETLRYFINLSGKSIGDKEILKYIKTSLPALKIDPSRIVFEITEDVAIAKLDTAKHFLAELRKFGFKTALDDFGVGYSSFSYLRELDVDFVKIDGSFINTMHTDEMNYALVKAINDICHILGKYTIAEFVQNNVALKLLKDIGVDYAQGYNIATAEDFDQHTIQFTLAN